MPHHHPPGAGKKNGSNATPPGRWLLKLKTPWRDGTTHLVMSPLELMQRLAALVPRPRLNCVHHRPVRLSWARLLKRVCLSWTWSTARTAVVS